MHSHLVIRPAARAMAALGGLLFAADIAAAAPAADAYESYVKSSQDFKPVKQDKDWCSRPTRAGRTCPGRTSGRSATTTPRASGASSNGYNGAFIDRDDVGGRDSKTGRLDWINKFGLRFYVDHLAGKRYLHMWDGASQERSSAEAARRRRPHAAGQRGHARSGSKS